MAINPVVTIGLPCFNAEKYVLNAINSILNQTFEDWELIIIDDNSTDKTCEVIKYFEQDERITIIKESQNRGLPFRLNQITKVAKGDFLVRMDADDIMDVNRIEYQLDFLRKNPHIDVLGTSAYAIDNKNQIIGLRYSNKTLTLKGAIKKCVFIHPTVMGHIKWFRENPYDENCIRMEDYELWVRTFSMSNFEILDVPLLFYREVGTPHFKKYWLSKLNAFRIIKGKKNIAYITKVLFVVVELLKGVIFSLITLLGLTDYLIRRRSKQIESSIKVIGEERLKKAIVVPNSNAKV